MWAKIYKILIFPYLILLLYLMFFGFGRTVMDDNIVRLEPFYSTARFVKDSMLYGRYFSIAINLIGNIVMFVPFGFLGLVFPKFNTCNTLLIDFLSSIIIVETLQYFTRRGVCDIDDVILNSAGVFLGFFLYKKLKYLW